MDGHSCFPPIARTRATSKTRAFLKTTLALFALVPLLLAPTGVARAQGGTISGVVLPEVVGVTNKNASVLTELRSFRLRGSCALAISSSLS
jgi:hypothetical protein